MLKPITRINYFSARRDTTGALRSFLNKVVNEMRRTKGCMSCRLLIDEINQTEFVVLEVWVSVEAHQKALAAVPKEQLRSVMQFLREPPKGEYLAPTE